MYYCSCDRDEVVNKCGIAKEFDTSHTSNTDTEYDKSTENKGYLIKIMSLKFMTINVKHISFSIFQQKKSRYLLEILFY